MILGGDKGGGITVWPLADGSKPQRLAGCRLPAPVLCLVAAPCGAPLLVAGCSDGSVHVVDWRADAVLRQLSRHSAEVQSVRWAAVGALPPPPPTDAADGTVAGDDLPAPPPPPPPQPDGPAMGQPGPAGGGGCHLLVTASADQTLRVYAAAPAEAGPAEGPGGSRPAAELAEALAPVSTLRLPKPPAGLTDSQRGRVWLTTAWVPSGAGDRSCAWLLSSYFGGALLGWQVPLAAGSAAAAVAPVRLKGGGHSRSIFSIHVSEEGAAAGAPPGCPRLRLFSAAMDRAVAEWSVPHPAAPGGSGDCWQHAKVRVVQLGGSGSSALRKYLHRPHQYHLLSNARAEVADPALPACAGGLEPDWAGRARLLAGCVQPRGGGTAGWPADSS